MQTNVAREYAKNVLHNTKVKVYPDGSYVLIRCNKKIFKSKFFETSETKNTEQIELYSIWSDLFTSLDENVITFRDDYGVPFKFWDVSKDEQFKPRKEFKECVVREDSVKRAKDAIFDIVYMNEWKYFITITFSKEDVDRTDPKEIIKKLNKWLDNRRQRKGLAYVLVPEYHEKGGIHCHALINDCDLGYVDSGTRLIKGFSKPVRLTTIREKHLCERADITEDDLKVVYNISDWKYGFSTAIETYGEPSQLAYYVTKYITKDVKKIFGKFYWSSKNIKRKPEMIFANTDFDDKLPCYDMPEINRKYQYESSHTFDNSGSDEDNRKKMRALCEELGIDYDKYME